MGMDGWWEKWVKIFQKKNFFWDTNNRFVGNEGDEIQKNKKKQTKDEKFNLLGICYAWSVLQRLILIYTYKKKNIVRILNLCWTYKYT